MAVEVILNGRRVELDGVRTIADLLASRGIKTTLVAVEQNGEIVPRSEFERREIAPGDRLEVVHFVGGG
ncbi:MAG: sulfur carrier protein ThiS [Thermomicrobiaceae bacterium]|nr:sulfur carrier protein ThiS [Thermomicrobiaceae bacterium]